MKRLLYIFLLIGLSAQAQTPIFDWDARTGSFRDQVSGTLGTNTNVDYAETVKGLSGRFSGSNTGIAFGTVVDFTGDKTFEAWVNPSTLVDDDNIFYGSDVRLYLRAGTLTYRMVSNGSTAVNSANSSVVFNKWSHIIVTRTSTGVTNFYVNGVLSGDADQVGGTPIAGGNLYIGNNYNNARDYYGDIGTVKIYNSILTTSQINNLYAKFLKATNVGETKQGVEYGTEAVTNALYRNTFKWEGVGNAPYGMRINSGAFVITETTSILDQSNAKYIDCTGNGSISINLGTTDTDKDATIYFYDGSWTKHTGTLADLITAQSWLSLSGTELVFTLTSSQNLGHILIKEGIVQ